ncbi:MAG TPA: hypothetical protein VIL46_07950, partial [Gemmataceae bacterium]
MSDRSAPPIFSAADLLSAPDLPPPWALPGLLPVGLTVLAYTPFAGQGKLALQVAAACAAGRPTLGAEPPGPASVLYIA